MTHNAESDAGLESRYARQPYPFSPVPPHRIGFLIGQAASAYGREGGVFGDSERADDLHVTMSALIDRSFTDTWSLRPPSGEARA